ncbi:calcium-dependent secretion activator 1 isoform X10, partial [Tachysurus ichikawai]
NVGRLVTPAKKLEDTLRLAELVIEVLQQNEEHHAEVSFTLNVRSVSSAFTHCKSVVYRF